MENELKPCPFCGNNPELIMHNLVAFESLEFGVHWIVVCRGCETRKLSSSKYRLNIDDSIDILRDGKKAVIDLWNRRAEDGK